MAAALGERAASAAPMPLAAPVTTAVPPANSYRAHQRSLPAATAPGTRGANRMPPSSIGPWRSVSTSWG